jgi:hypothetical protein
MKIISTMVGVFCVISACTIGIQNANALTIVVDQAGKKVSMDGQTFPAVTPMRNKQSLIPPGNYNADDRYIPPCVKTSSGVCKKNSWGLVVMEKSGVTGNGQRVSTQNQDLGPWGSLHRSVVPIVFLNIIQIKAGFQSAIHSEVINCGRTGITKYLASPVNYFGENPLDNSAVPGCAPPPKKVIPRYGSHGCFRLGHLDLWKVYTAVWKAKESGEKITIKVLP